MAKKHRGRPVDGLIVLDKAQGATSNACLQQVKRLLNAAKAGHTGALDPLATGVLPLCFGEATKVSQFLLESDKAYRASIRLGQKTTTGDCEGEVLASTDTVSVNATELESALDGFRGELEQLPPMYSALKHQGVPLYRLAREGREVERQPRHIRIDRLDLLEFDGVTLTVDIHCSKGTYIRTIADDLGERLGCGGHIVALRRTRAGPFSEDASITFAELASLVEASGPAAADPLLIPADEAITHLPAARLNEEMAEYVRHGQAVFLPRLPVEGLVRLYGGDTFLGVGQILDDGRVGPKRLLKT